MLTYAAPLPLHSNIHLWLQPLSAKCQPDNSQGLRVKWNINILTNQAESQESIMLSSAIGDDFISVLAFFFFPHLLKVYKAVAVLEGRGGLTCAPLLLSNIISSSSVLNFRKKEKTEERKAALRLIKSTWNSDRTEWFGVTNVVGMLVSLGAEG